MSFLAVFEDVLPYLIVATSGLGALLVVLMQRRGLPAANRAAIFASTLTLGIAVWLLVHGPNSATTVSQLPGAFCLDDLSLGPVFVVAVIGCVVLWMGDRCDSNWSSWSAAEFLVGQTLAFVLFLTHDFLTFLLTCEIWTWWAFFAIGRAGGIERRQSAQRFLLSTTIGHLAWGLAGIGCAIDQEWLSSGMLGENGNLSLLFSDIVSLRDFDNAGQQTPTVFRPAIHSGVFTLWLVGLWFRGPFFPWQRWWQSFYAEGRAPVIALIAATAVLTTGFVCFRFVRPNFPDSASVGSLVLIAVAAVGICSGSLRMLRQTEGRLPGSLLSLFSLQMVLVTMLTGTETASPIAWQTLQIVSLAIAAERLLAGRWEKNLSHNAFSHGNRLTGQSPRGFGLYVVCAGTLLVCPLLPWVSQVDSTKGTHLDAPGIANLLLLAGTLLACVAVVRVLWRLGMTRSAEPRSTKSKNEILSDDLRGREHLIGGFFLAAIFVSLCTHLEQPGIEPWSEQVQREYQFSPNADSQQMAKFSTASPLVSYQSKDFPTPMVWMVTGALLMVASRVLKQGRWVPLVGGTGLCLGLVMTLLGSHRSTGQSNVFSCWILSVFWSLGITGLMLVSLDGSHRRAMSLGAWIMRLGAIGWAAVTHDLILTGLTWELAELAGRLCDPPHESESLHAGRERTSSRVSSVCFWGGVVLCFLVLGTTDLLEITVRPGQYRLDLNRAGFWGRGPFLGLIAVLLVMTALWLRCEGDLRPWQRRHLQARSLGEPAFCDQWLRYVLGLAVFIPVILAFHESYGESIGMLLTMAVTASVLVSSTFIKGENRVWPTLHHWFTWQFQGFLLLLAGWSLAGMVEKSAAVADYDLIYEFAGGLFLLTIAFCGLIAMLRRLGTPSFGELYFEYYAGLFSKRWLDAVLLLGSVWALVGLGPTGGYWLRWMRVISNCEISQQITETGFFFSVGLWGATFVWIGAFALMMIPLGQWSRHVAFDPAVSSWRDDAGQRWLIVAVLALGYGVITGFAPYLLSELMAD